MQQYNMEEVFSSHGYVDFHYFIISNFVTIISLYTQLISLEQHVTGVTPVAAISRFGSPLGLAGEDFRKIAVFGWRKERKLLPGTSNH